MPLKLYQKYQTVGNYWRNVQSATRINEDWLLSFLGESILKFRFYLFLPTTQYLRVPLGGIKVAHAYTIAILMSPLSCIRNLRHRAQLMGNFDIFLEEYTKPEATRIYEDWLFCLP